MKRILLVASLAIGMSFIPVPFNIQDIVGKLTEYSLKYPQEKIFLHFDKPGYSTGETVWFKAYLVDAFSNEPITLSKVIHVELLDSEMKSIGKRMLKAEKGGAAGDFLLEDSLPPGTYHIRAYTNWMRNFNDEFFYRSSFKVLKTYVEEENKPVEIEPRLNFFPEGGNLIAGTATIVAIKATDQYGRAIKVSGIISDKADGAEITTLDTDDHGMGAILLNPEGGQSLKATIDFKGKDYEFDLPGVQESGYSMRVINNYQSDKITIAVTAKDKPLSNGGLIAHHSGEVFYSAVNQSNESAFAVRLDRKDFPAGICHITFFDPDGQPQAERLIYANYPKSRPVSLSKKSTYEKRSPVKLSFLVADSLQGNIASNLSVSITPQELVQHSQNGENIVNYLGLTSDLVGLVENPQRYLERNKSAFNSLDLLLMTQGWRRFKWDEVLNYDPVASPQFWAEDGIILSGQVVDHEDRGQPRESQVSLSILNGTGFIQGETDPQGRFFFSGNDFYDSTNLLFQAQRKMKKEGKYQNDVFIKLDNSEPPLINEESYSKEISVIHEKKKEVYLEEKKKIEKIQQNFDLSDDAIMLNAVQVTGVRDKTQDPFESPYKIYGEPTSRIVADSIMRGGDFINIFDLFQRMPGVRVIGSLPRQSVQIGGIGSVNSGTNPLFILDGVYVNSDVLYSITPSSVSHIDVLMRADAAIYGAQGANGVIAIYTKGGLGIVDKKPKDMGILNHAHPGYSKVREFFSPNYEIPKDEHAKPDYRTTLYWNPTILVEGEDPAEVSFYTSDQVGAFDIIVQGISVDGLPLYLRDTLKVE